MCRHKSSKFSYSSARCWSPLSVVIETAMRLSCSAKWPQLVRNLPDAHMLMLLLIAIIGAWLCFG